MPGRITLATTACLLAMALPASSAEPVATDPCGDVLFRAYMNDVGETSVPDPRERPLDIQGLSFESLFERDEDEPEFLGVDVSLELCSPAQLPAPGEGFTVSWGVEPSPFGGDECTESVTLFHGRTLGLATYIAARYEHACQLPDSLPYGSGYTALWSQQLSPTKDVTLSGGTIIWKLRAASLEPPMVGRLAVGKVWREPRALTRGTDGQATTSTFQPDEGVSVTVGAVADEAGPGTDFVVGS